MQTTLSLFRSRACCMHIDYETKSRRPGEGSVGHRVGHRPPHPHLMGMHEKRNCISEGIRINALESKSSLERKIERLTHLTDATIVRAECTSWSKPTRSMASKVRLLADTGNVNARLQSSMNTGNTIKMRPEHVAISSIKKRSSRR